MVEGPPVGLSVLMEPVRESVVSDIVPECRNYQRQCVQIREAYSIDSSLDEHITDLLSHCRPVEVIMIRDVALVAVIDRTYEVEELLLVYEAIEPIAF